MESDSSFLSSAVMKLALSEHSQAVTVLEKRVKVP
jgi:hypothetical protein